ncbi:hypothetical protein V6N11_008542 [Hibiscus sabdariffa]|uniref:Uncharacterized protein n=2 Tax=Hibiscus sabdariffa TaxID=183260 RepID=A0ABR1Z8S2_9ROSI
MDIVEGSHGADAVIRALPPPPVASLAVEHPTTLLSSTIVVEAVMKKYLDALVKGCNQPIRAEKERVDDGESRKLYESSLKRITGHMNDEALRHLASLEFPRNEESDAPREVEGGDVSGKSKGNSQEKDCCNNETIPILAPFIDTNGSCKIFEGIDEACPFDLKDPCRRNGKSIASVEDRDLTLERNSFELPELHDMYKESQINKNKFTMGDMTCVTFYSSFEGNWRNLLGVSRITVNVDDLEESVEYDDGEF